jgi:putative ABC transport system permease protein
LLSLIAGAAGVIIAVWGVDALTILAPPGTIPRVEEVRLDRWALAFTFGTSILTGILFGLAPAMQATQRDFAADTARTNVSSQRGGTLRSALVVSEIAIALVLLIGAGLLIRSFVRLRSVDLGFKTEHVVTASMELPDRVYDSAAKMHRFQDDLLARIGHLPGVTAEGLVNWLPLGSALIFGGFVIEGQPAPKNVIAAKPVISPGYFRTMGIRVLRGRPFSDRDTASSEPVAIVDESFARRFWPGQDPVGKRISVAEDPKPDDWMTIVGVVEGVHQESPAAPKLLTLYQPFSQVQVPFFLQTTTVVVRTDANLQTIATALRASVREVDRNQPIRTLATMDELLDASTAEPRFHTRVLSVFSSIAFLLAMIGIYGVIAYSVTQRTREIGVRMAVGAQAADILKLIIGRSAMLVAAGIVLGTAGAFAATRVLRNFLFEVDPTDPVTFAGVAILLALIALFASYLPARRAARIDPMTALRWE